MNAVFWEYAFKYVSIVSWCNSHTDNVQISLSSSTKDNLYEYMLRMVLGVK